MNIKIILILSESIFFGNAMDESLYQQHKEEQERIDNLINNKTETKKEGSFDFGEIWDMLGWED